MADERSQDIKNDCKALGILKEIKAENPMPNTQLKMAPL
jgi:hypothetical protein